MPRSPNFATVLPLIPPSPPDPTSSSLRKPKDPAAAENSLLAFDRFHIYREGGRRAHALDRGRSSRRRSRSVSPFKTSWGGKLISHRSDSTDDVRRPRCSLERNEKLPLVCGYEIPTCVVLYVRAGQTLSHPTPPRASGRVTFYGS